MTRRKWASAILFSTVGLMLACSDTEAVDRLERLPEGKLVTPGAVLVHEIRDKGGFISTTGPVVKRVYDYPGHTYAEALAFYDKELRDRDWRPVFRVRADASPEWTDGKHRILLGETSLPGTTFSVTVLEAKE